MANVALKNCPICQKPSVEKVRPFCSTRCADIDLGRWFNEFYAAPTDEVLDLEDDDAPIVH